MDDASPVPVDVPGHARLHRHDSTRGFVASANRGARLARTGALVFLNDDTIVTPGWLEVLLRGLEAERCGLVGPASNDSGDAATVDARYEDLEGLLRYAARRAEGAMPPRPVPKLSLFCAAMDRALFERVGGLDEGYGLGGFEDDELCMTLRRRGRRVLLMPTAFVHHHGSVTFDALGATERIARFEINRRRFERRWRTRWRAPTTPVGAGG